MKLTKSLMQIQNNRGGREWFTWMLNKFHRGYYNSIFWNSAFTFIFPSTAFFPILSISLCFSLSLLSILPYLSITHQNVSLSLSLEHSSISVYHSPECPSLSLWLHLSLCLFKRLMNKNSVIVNRETGIWHRAFQCRVHESEGKKQLWTQRSEKERGQGQGSRQEHPSLHWVRETGAEGEKRGR